MALRSVRIILLLSILGGNTTSCTTKSISENSDHTISKNETFQGSDSLKHETNIYQHLPSDTVRCQDTHGRHLNLVVFSYYDSLSKKGIKNFVVTDDSTNSLVFRSVSNQFFIEDEVDPINGIFDSLRVVPVYTISSTNPLIVTLRFYFNGSFRLNAFEELSYPFYKLSSSYFDFLEYHFRSEGIPFSKLSFKPAECGKQDGELKREFNMLSNLDLKTDKASELLRESFICYLNGKNGAHGEIEAGYRKAFKGSENFPYVYFPFVTFLNSFIINLSSE